MKAKAAFRIVGTNTYLRLEVENHDDPQEYVEQDLESWGKGRSLSFMGMDVEETNES